jgi:hypothetical protein
VKTDTEQIAARLRKLIALLGGAGSPRWANALTKALHELPSDPRAAKAQIIASFGGMGSLNDVVLYRDGQPLARENDELDSLRSELYELCRRAEGPGAG